MGQRILLDEMTNTERQIQFNDAVWERMLAEPKIRLGIVRLLPASDERDELIGLMEAQVENVKTKVAEVTAMGTRPRVDAVLHVAIAMAHGDRAILRALSHGSGDKLSGGDSI